MINNKRKCLYTLIYFSKVLFSRRNEYIFEIIIYSLDYLNILTFYNDM